MSLVTRGSWLGAAAITASATLSLGADKIPGTGVVAYHLSINHVGAGATTWAHANRIRVKSGGGTIIDCTVNELRAYLQRMARGNTVQAANALTLTIPLYIPDEKGDARYASQFPPGQAPIVEVDWAAGASTGDTLNVAWTQAPGIESVFFPQLFGEAHNIPANIPRQLFTINRGGLIRNFIIPTTGLNTARVTLTNVLLFSTDSPLLQESQRLENSENMTLSDPICLKLDEPMPAAVGVSNIEFGTGAAWVATGEVATFSLIPLKQSA